MPRKRSRPAPSSPRATGGASPSTVSIGPSRPWLPWACAVALTLVAAWAYAPSFDGVLVLDDIRAIARNPTIRSLWPITTPLSPPKGATVSARPVANLSFAINYALAPAEVRDVFAPGPPGGPPDAAERFRRNLWGYHLGNLLIHLAVTLVLAAVVRRTLQAPRLRHRPGQAATPLAILAAGLWMVHPLHTESVTYVVQRVESLMSLFYLLTIYAAIRADAAERRAWWVGAAVLSAVLGMATKEVMVTVPLAVAAWYFLFGDPDDAARRRQFANVGALAVTWVVLAGLVIAEHRGPSVALDAATIWSYLLTQGEVIVHYVRLSLWPAPLVFLYTWPLTASWGQAPYVLGVMAALGLTLYGLLRRNPLAYAGVLFFLVLAPTSSVLPIVTEVAAEHRMYLPLAALVASFVVGLWRVVDALVSRRDSGERSTRLPLIATTAVVVALMGPLAVATRARNRDYSSEERLWADTVAKQPANQRARVAYGMALAATGRWADAERELREAVALEPRDPVANSRLGVILATAGQFDAALVHLDRAAAVRPGDIETQRALGRIRVMRREDAQALRHLESVLAAQPDDPSVLLQIAGLLVDSSDASVRNPGRAVRLSEQALRIVGRRDPRILNLLSAALAADGRLADAAAAASDGAAAARAAGDEALASALEERATRYRAAPAPWMR